MKSKFYFLLLAIGFSIAACQKEFSKESNGNPQNGTNDSTVLKAFVLLDTASGNPDTLNVTTFEYDNLKRLSKEVTMNYFNNVPDPTDDHFTTYYYYNGADTVPAKTIVVAIDSSGNNQLGVDSVVSFFTRNANQQITRDSSYYMQFTRSQGPAQGVVYITVSNFSIYADSVVENFRFTDPLSGLLVGTNKYVQTKSNGNLIKEVLFILENTGYREVRSIDFAYDTKINPFIIRSANYPVVLKDDFGTRDYIFKNNETMVVGTISTNTPPQVNTTTSSYTYNTLGYPKTVAQHDTGDPTLGLKGIYIYTK